MPAFSLELALTLLRSINVNDNGECDVTGFLVSLGGFSGSLLSTSILLQNVSTLNLTHYTGEFDGVKCELVGWFQAYRLYGRSLVFFWAPKGVSTHIQRYRPLAV